MTGSSTMSDGAGSGSANSGSEGKTEQFSLSTIGSEFPIKANRCYFNNASIGALANPVVAAVNSFLTDVQQNGRNNYPNWCRYADTTVKERIGRLIGGQPGEIAFIKNTTEGLATVANGLDWRDGDNVIIADIEYPSNVYCWMKLASRGVELRWVKNRNGRILVENIAPLIDKRTRLISLSAVQFSNGFRQDLATTSELCSRHGVLLNLDGIQWVGALVLDLAGYKVDFLSAGAHKWLLGPIGTGFFYCRKSALDSLDPPTVGYHTVDKVEDHMDYELIYRPDAGRFEEALVNFPGIWGLDTAVKIQLALGPQEIERHILGLNALAAEKLRSKSYQIVSPAGEGERSGILSFRHPKVASDEIANRLSQAGVDVAVRGNALRISPSYYNDEQEVGRFIEALPNM